MRRGARPRRPCPLRGAPRRAPRDRLAHGPRRSRGLALLGRVVRRLRDVLGALEAAIVAALEDFVSRIDGTQDALVYEAWARGFIEGQAFEQERQGRQGRGGPEKWRPW